MPTLFDVRLPQRFWDKVVPEPNGGCWLWIAAALNNGYGVLGVLGTKRTTLAHRLSYIALVGAIPDGLDLDHLCRVRCCVNPAHLEPVTRRENLRRGIKSTTARAATHCSSGHLWSTSALIRSNGKRQCRECQKTFMANWLAKKDAA